MTMRRHGKAEPSDACDRRSAMSSIRLTRVFAATGLLLVAAIVSAGCGFGGGTSSSGALVTVQMRGGECVNGPCDSSVILDQDGRVHAAAKPPNDLGTVPADQMAALRTAIGATDFDELRTHPFTGECPTAFDGQELIYEFATPAGTQRIASCEVQIDYGSPLFVAVSNALGPFIPLPLT